MAKFSNARLPFCLPVRQRGISYTFQEGTKRSFISEEINSLQQKMRMPSIMRDQYLNES